MLGLAALFFGFQAGGDVRLALVPVLPMLVGLYGFGFAFAVLVLIMREANTMVELLKIPTLLPLRWKVLLLVVFMAAMLWLGAWAFAALERRVRRSGALGQH